MIDGYEVKPPSDNYNSGNPIKQGANNFFYI